MRRRPLARPRDTSSPPRQLTVQKAGPFQLAACNGYLVATRISDITGRTQAEHRLHEPADWVVREAASAKGVPGSVVEVGGAEEREEKDGEGAEFVLLEEGEGGLDVG